MSVSNQKRINCSAFNLSGKEVYNIHDSVDLKENDNDALATQKSIKAYIDGTAAGKDEFIELNDTFSTYTKNNALIKVNYTLTGIEETGVRLTEISDSEFKLKSNDDSTILDVSNSCNIDQNLSQSSNVKFNKVTTGYIEYNPSISTNILTKCNIFAIQSSSEPSEFVLNDLLNSTNDNDNWGKIRWIRNDLGTYSNTGGLIEVRKVGTATNSKCKMNFQVSDGSAMNTFLTIHPDNGILVPHSSGVKIDNIYENSTGVGTRFHDKIICEVIQSPDPATGYLTFCMNKLRLCSESNSALFEAINHESNAYDDNTTIGKFMFKAANTNMTTLNHIFQIRAVKVGNGSPGVDSVGKALFSIVKSGTSLSNILELHPTDGIKCYEKIQVDNIEEKSTGNGVTIEQNLLKDNKIKTQNLSINTTANTYPININTLPSSNNAINIQYQLSGKASNIGVYSDGNPYIECKTNYIDFINSNDEEVYLTTYRRDNTLTDNTDHGGILCSINNNSVSKNVGSIRFLSDGSGSSDISNPTKIVFKNVTSGMDESTALIIDKNAIIDLTQRATSGIKFYGDGTRQHLLNTYMHSSSSHSFTSDIWASNHSINYNYVRIGNQVTLHFEECIFTTNGTGSDYIKSSSALYDWLKPKDNGFYSVQRVKGITGAKYGVVFIGTDGIIKIYSTAVLDNFGCDGSTAGFYPFTLTYVGKDLA